MAPSPDRVLELMNEGLSHMQAIDYIKVVEDGMTATAWGETTERGEVRPQTVASNVREAKQRLGEGD